MSDPFAGAERVPSDASDRQAQASPTLLDGVLPTFDYRTFYCVDVDAPAATVIEAAEAYRLNRSAVVRFLFRLRGLGDAPSTLRSSLSRGGFLLLAEQAGREIVFGVAGRFWAVNERGSIVALADARAFVDFDRPGFAKAAINFRAEPSDGGRTRLVTETRVRCCDAVARRRFALYWAFIRPFSGWIRRIMLRGIQRDAIELARRAELVPSTVR